MKSEDVDLSDCSGLVSTLTEDASVLGGDGDCINVVSLFFAVVPDDGGFSSSSSLLETLQVI